jgi:hypothetical protein
MRRQVLVRRTGWSGVRRRRLAEARTAAAVAARSFVVSQPHGAAWAAQARQAQTRARHPDGQALGGRAR